MSLNTSSTTSDIVPFSAAWLKTLEAVTSGTVTLSGAVTGSGLVGSTISTTLSSGIDATKIADGTVSNTEFQYLNNVSSSIQTQLDGKVTANAAITGATKTKITYDSKGLVTAGADATTADIADSSNKRYVTDADLTKLGNLSGTNTGDQNVFSTIAVAGQNNVVADSTSDTLTLVAGSNITLTTSDTGDSVTIASTGGGSLSGSGTTNELAYWTGTTSLGALTTATYPSLTELSYVKGVTSAIQTQLNGKEPTITAGTSSQYWRGDKTWQTFNLDALTDVVLTSPTNGQVLGYNGTNWVNTSTGASGVTGSGVSGRVPYWDSTSSITSAAEFLYDSTNADLTVGTAKLGDVSGYAMFAHSSNFSFSGYGFLQDSAGTTYISAPTGQTIRFRLNNSDTNGMVFDGTYWTIWYDTSNKMSMNCSSTGVFSFAAYSGTAANKFTFNSAVEVPDSAYGVGWDGSTAVPTRNAVYDKIESVISGTIPSAFYGHVPTGGGVWRIPYQTDDASFSSVSTFIYDENGLGVGVTATAAEIHALSTTTQLRLDYSSTQYMSTTVSSAGTVTFDAVGTTPKFVFSDDVEVPDSAYGAGWNGSTAVPTRNAVYDRVQDVALATITFVIDGGGSAITTGIKGDLEIPFACTIEAATLLADQTGSIVIDIWKDTYANYPPTVADTITASAKPTLSSANKTQNTTLTGWTTAINAGDTLRFNVDSATTVQRVTLSLKVRR